MVRPKDMLDLEEKAKKSGSDADRQAHERMLADYVAEVVKKQADTGIDIVNDGEYGKSSWAAYIIERVGGFDVRSGKLAPLVWLGRDLERFPEQIEMDIPEARKGRPEMACVGPIVYDDRYVKRDAANLANALKSVNLAEGFITSVAPASAGLNTTNEYYKSEEEFVYAIADALAAEYRAIHDAGFVLQVDDAVLANMYDYLTQQSDETFRKWAELRIEALIYALKGIPEDRIRYHLCFGSWHVPHTTDAPLEALVDLVLRVPAGAYSIEAANPRHEHEWRVWETTKLPEGRILIPGVVTHHTVTVEHPRVVADRIVRYANIVGKENVIAGTDCGFSQNKIIERVHPKTMWAKFATLVEGAKLASQELWG
jgi:5-methyltetrahydropteroyltriglutamate--homocysteine methyltransferase